MFGVGVINGFISDFLVLDERATENVVHNTIRRMYRSMHVENGGDDHRAARQVCPSLDDHYRAYMQFAGQVVSACRTDHYTASSTTILTECVQHAMLLFGGRAFESVGRGSVVARLNSEVHGIACAGGTYDVLINTVARAMGLSGQSSL